ncbi:hypothetical protein POPTR_005G172250v4 [Populus trichocarpa]|uniref:Uncharacterized protein n=1 Tax=Populus trichocarpa TaxID=3694 RepID=A0ACC0T137_POPTR|nr:hypothetical protein POPTR_005G172250v4 [Populus trichocarpa]
MIRTSNPHFPCSEDSASHSDEQLELLFFYFSVVLGFIYILSGKVAPWIGKGALFVYIIIVVAIVTFYFFRCYFLFVHIIFQIISLPTK